MKPTGVVAAGSVLLALVTGSPAAGVIALAYGLVGCRVVQRRRKRAAVAKRRAESLELLALASADLRAGSAGAMPVLLLPDPGLDRLAQAAQRLSDRSGAPLAALLERIEGQQRVLSRAESAAYAQAAGIRATAVLLTALPLAALGLGHLIGANAYHFLLHTPVGLACAAAAIALQLTGLAWADRLAEGSRKRPVAQAELAAAADLIAAALRTGMPVSTAVLSAADTLPGPLSRPLLRIGHELRLGVAPEVAWQGLAVAEATPTTGYAAKALVRAAKRSAMSGSALSGALTRCADDLRTDATDERLAQLQRAAVLLVLPLGLCFLPAFLLAGLVPVILAVLDDVIGRGVQ